MFTLQVTQTGWMQTCLKNLLTEIEFINIIDGKKYKSRNIKCTGLALVEGLHPTSWQDFTKQ